MTNGFGGCGLCSDIVTLYLDARQDDPAVVASLKGISPVRACVLAGRPMRVGASVLLECSRCAFRGQTQQCTISGDSYLVTIAFEATRPSGKNCKHAYSNARLLFANELLRRVLKYRKVIISELNSLAANTEETRKQLHRINPETPVQLYQSLVPASKDRSQE